MIRYALCIQFILLFGATAAVCLDTKPHIILVHLGDALPSYIYTALEQARLFNENANVCLIANQKALNNSAYDFSRQSIVIVACETLPQSSAHKKFNHKTKLNLRDRDGFWRKVTERFFYIHEYVALHNLTTVVHLESDNMLYANIADMRNALSLYKGIGAVFDADNRCVPSFVYIANEKAIAHLINFIAKHASRGLSDMQIIALYHKTFSRDYIDNLPLIMPEYLRDHALISSENKTTQHPLDYCRHNEAFNSIFDGAAFGQYLGGTDPRNGPSKPGFINETCLFNPSHLPIEWHRDEQNRNVPFARCNGTLYRINNLHIHSKFLENFRSSQ
jgi:hypothetical protein